MPRRRKVGLSKQQKDSMKKHTDEINRMSLFSKPVRKVKVTTNTKNKTIQDIVNETRNTDVKIVSGTITSPVLQQPVSYEDEEMAKREQTAQAEIERKKLRVAPMYNKGAYQYITDDTDPKTLGRKI